MNGWKDHMSRDSQLYRRGKFLSPYFRVRQFVVCTFHKLSKKYKKRQTGKLRLSFQIVFCLDFKISQGGLSTYQRLHQASAKAPDLLQVAVDVKDPVLLAQLNVGVNGNVDSRSPSTVTLKKTKTFTTTDKWVWKELGHSFITVTNSSQSHQRQIKEIILVSLIIILIKSWSYLQWTITGPSWVSGCWFITCLTLRLNSSRALLKGFEWQGHSV